LKKTQNKSIKMNNKEIPVDPRSKLYQTKEIPFIVSSSPHLYTGDSVPRIMWTVIVALMPAVVASIVFFGTGALLIIFTCILTAVISEAFINRVKRESLTIRDGSAAITGLLLALTLPPSFPLSGCIIGSVFAITIGKQIFGGLGYNIFNPALLARAFLQASFPVAMTTWTYPVTKKYAIIDSVTAATPLGILKFEGKDKILIDYFDLFVGNIGGSLGEVSALAILAGALILLIKKYIDWRIPLSYLGIVFISGAVFWLFNPDKYPDPLFHLLTGGLFLGAFFMATDMVTSPITPRGSWIFGTGAGILLIIIRLFGGLPEGVMYSILLMNAVTPLINRYTKPKIFGEDRR
jgi:electron transport complex protein RnfD